MKKILEIEPLQFDFFAKIFGKISKNSSFDPIYIKDSKIMKKMNTAYVFCDFEKLFNGQKVTLNILDHQKASKIFSTIKTDQDIIVFEDDEYYYFTYKFGNNDNLMFTISLLKAADEQETEEVFNEDNYDLISEKKIDKDIFNSLKKISKAVGVNKISFYFDKNKKLKAIGLDSNGYISFDDKFNVDKADLILESDSFFIFDCEEMKIKIYKNKDDDEYIGIFEINFGFPIDFKLIEVLRNADEELDL